IRRHRRVAGARVTVLPSGQVVIKVAERRARAAVPHSNGFLIVDPSGVVIDSRRDRAGLPALLVAGLSLPWVRLGDALPAPQIRPALEVLRLLPPAIRQNGIDIRMDASEEFTIVTSDGVSVLLGPLRGLRERAAMLPEILVVLRAQKIAVQYLDLRFTGNVVVRPALPVSGEGVGP
ncbi:MAG: cell division protein FtsQ/DivIB, partial [bacterium]